jgi:hypothetical protein
MGESKIENLGSVKLQAQYVSSKWKVLVRAISKAIDDLERVKVGLDADEVNNFYRVVRGEAYSAALNAVMQRTPIDGSERLNVEFLEPYVPGFVTGKIQAIPAGESLHARGTDGDQVEAGDLNHWQIKRGYCYHLADVNLKAALDYVKKRKFDSAMMHLCRALMQIGAASVRDPAEIAQMAETENAKRRKAAQDTKWDQVRQFAFEQATQANYKSRRQAVIAIKDQVLKKASDVGLKMSSERADKTIDGWLSDRGYNPSASKRSTSSSKRSTSES